MKNNLGGTGIKLTITALLCLPCALAWAGDKSVNPMENMRPLPPGPPRYLENYGFLEDPVKRVDPFDKARFIPLSKGAWLQLGGQVRFAYYDEKDPGFGLQGVEDDVYTQARYQLHADMHLLDDAVRVFAQLEDTETYDRQIKAATDQSDAEIHQGFVDFGLISSNRKRGYVRVGRQEMVYGSGVLFGYRDVPNVRRTFDGLRVSYSGAGGYNFDAFAVRPVGDLRQGSFNDGSQDSGELYGAYFTKPWSDNLSQELYAVGFHQEDRNLNGFVGDDKRYTFGTRFFGNYEGVSYSSDVIYQLGEHGDQDVRAWATQNEVGYTVKGMSWKPGFFMDLNVASGDRNPSDKETNTFDPLFTANGKFYGNGGLITLTNIVAAGPRFSISPRKNIDADFAVKGLWRESDKDGAYLPGGRMLAGSTKSNNNKLGNFYNASLRWRITPNITLDADYAYYDVGETIKEAGGRDTQIISIRPSFLF